MSPKPMGPTSLPWIVYAMVESQRWTRIAFELHKGFLGALRGGRMRGDRLVF